MAGFTKEIIVRTLFELLNEKPLSKITVKDIVERCGVNRNTFYYHFRDIPDVVEYGLKREVDRILESNLEMENLLDGIMVMVGLINENKKAMLHIYRSVQRDAFARYLSEIADYLISRYISVHQDTVKGIAPEDAKLLMHFQKCILAGVILDWLEQGMSYDMEAYVKRLGELYGDSLDRLAENARRVNPERRA